MKAKPFLIAFAAVVVIIAAGSFYIGTTIDRSDKTVVTVPSPDGKFNAVKVSVTGGGAAPFCFDSISVLLGVYPDGSAERRREYEIYSATCGTFANGEASPKIEWQSPSALQITYAAGSKAPDSAGPRTRDIDVTKSVRVTFVERP